MASNANLVKDSAVKFISIVFWPFGPVPGCFCEWLRLRRATLEGRTLSVELVALKAILECVYFHL